MKEKKELRVWWIPQIPMSPFHVKVKSIQDAKLILDTLANYDLFQFNNNIKPDYCNMGGLEELDKIENEWLEWCDEDGDTIDETILLEGK